MLRTESIEPLASVRRYAGTPRCLSNAVASRTRVAPYVLGSVITVGVYVGRSTR